MTPTWQSKNGDIQLYCGDCLTILPHIGKVDAVVTDPPYGINKAEWDDEFNADDIDLWFSFASIVCVVPGVWALGRCIQAMGTHYVWTVAGFKPAAMTNGRIGLSKWQPIVVGGKVVRCGADAFQFHPSDTTGLNGHPCQKPEQFMIWLVAKLTPEKAIILDPYMGSGTTGIACIRTGRRFIGIEISPEYFELAKNRIETELRQPSFRLQYQKQKPHAQQGFAL
jgi:site-specific DNA-methyltransferase (adenine-specific)/modification methylase